MIILDILDGGTQQLQLHFCGSWESKSLTSATLYSRVHTNNEVYFTPFLLLLPDFYGRNYINWCPNKTRQVFTGVQRLQGVVKQHFVCTKNPVLIRVKLLSPCILFYQ